MANIIGDDNPNFLIGGADADQITGLGGDDILYGGADATNTLAGGDNAVDTLKGGNGDDTYFVNFSTVSIAPLNIHTHSPDQVIEESGAGTDTVIIFPFAPHFARLQGFHTAAYTLTANVENGIIAVDFGLSSDYPCSLSGNELNNNLIGNRAANTLNGFAGDDQIDGGDGNDTLNGGDGNDLLGGNTGADALIGGAGIDTATYTESAAGVNVNLTAGVGIGGSAAGDTLTGIENLTGSNLADTLIGNSLANTLNGFAGNDLLRGNTGADALIGGAGIDTATYTESAAGVNVNLTTGVGIGGSAAGDTLNGIENLTGSNLADTLTGNGLANALNGFGGNDLLTGGLGRDVLTGGVGFDRFDFNSVAESVPGAFRDVITDFVGNGSLAGDVIDVSTIDANVLLLGNQAFTFIGGAAFSAAGQLRYSGGVLQGNTNADLSSEFQVALTGAPVLTSFDLIL